MFKKCFDGKRLETRIDRFWKKCARPVALFGLRTLCLLCFSLTERRVNSSWEELSTFTIVNESVVFYHFHRATRVIFVRKQASLHKSVR